jgi:hypothetical protein
VQSEELKTFQDAFSNNLPWDAKPLTLFIIAIVAVSVYLVYLKIFNKEKLDYS